MNNRDSAFQMRERELRSGLSTGASSTSDEEGAPRRKHGDTEAAEAQNRRGSSKLTEKRGEKTRFDDHGCSPNNGGANRDGGGSAVAVTQLEEESGIGG
ncbi:uncharacterized protein DS421_9g262700 [Arachis hypogaea]|nr:uncharacterized protein DS421_9g262700 [Arachis hypogaea]